MHISILKTEVPLDNERVTLGLDPSINYPGHAVFIGKKLEAHGLRRTWQGTKPSDQVRLRQLLCDVGSLCSEYKPDVVVIEDYQFRDSDVTDRNKNNLKKMIWAIGVCIVAVPTSCSEIVLVTPMEWKGRKSKGETVNEARVIYGLRGDLNNNVADAIMIAHHYISGVVDVYNPAVKPIKAPRYPSRLVKGRR